MSAKKYFVELGQIFGKWTVIGAGKNGQYSLCRCSCGNEKDIYKGNLINGISLQCKECHHNRATLLPSQKFGKRTVIAQEGRTRNGQKTYRVRCECGKEDIVACADLTFGKALSCNYCPLDYPLIGEKFGRRTIIADMGVDVDGRRLYKVKCSCGQEKTLNWKAFSRGKSYSCLSCHQKTHDLSSHPLYGTWNRIVGRCTNPNDTNFHQYGMRGIKIFSGWKNDPTEFIKYIESLPNAYDPEKKELDRIDNNGNYEPGNLRWASRLENLLNRNVCYSKRKAGQKFMLVPIEQIKSSYLKGAIKKSIGQIVPGQSTIWDLV